MYGERGNEGNGGNAAFEKAWQNFCEKKDGISFVRGLGAPIWFCSWF